MKVCLKCKNEYHTHNENGTCKKCSKQAQENLQVMRRLSWNKIRSMCNHMNPTDAEGVFWYSFFRSLNHRYNVDPTFRSYFNSSDFEKLFKRYHENHYEKNIVS